MRSRQMISFRDEARGEEQMEPCRIKHFDLLVR